MLSIGFESSTVRFAYLATILLPLRQLERAGCLTRLALAFGLFRFGDLDAIPDESAGRIVHQTGITHAFPFLV